MIVPALVLIGAATGALTARRRGGRAADMAQYAFGYAVAFGLVGMVASVLYVRLAA